MRWTDAARLTKRRHEARRARRNAGRAAPVIVAAMAMIFTSACTDTTRPTPASMRPGGSQHYIVCEPTDDGVPLENCVSPERSAGSGGETGTVAAGGDEKPLFISKFYLTVPLPASNDVMTGTATYKEYVSPGQAKYNYAVVSDWGRYEAGTVTITLAQSITLRAGGKITIEGDNFEITVADY